MEHVLLLIAGVGNGQVNPNIIDTPVEELNSLFSTNHRDSKLLDFFYFFGVKNIR